jgi:hypothetical protein
MHRLREALEKHGSEKAAWALAYIDLWYCTNFHRLYWGRLVQRDRRNIRFAIQAALYVWWSSGSDSSSALADLIAASSCWAEAREYLDDLSQVEDRDWWLDKVLASQQGCDR